MNIKNGGSWRRSCGGWWGVQKAGSVPIEKSKVDLSTEQSFDHPVSASRRIIKNTFFLAIADVVNKAMMFVFYLVAARHLSVEQFGVLSFATTFVTMWSVFSDLGLGVVSARELARDRIEGRRQVNIALAIKLVATLLVIGLIVLVVNLMKLNSEKVRVVYIATIFCSPDRFYHLFLPVYSRGRKNCTLQQSVAFCKRWCLSQGYLCCVPVRHGSKVIPGFTFLPG